MLYYPGFNDENTIKNPFNFEMIVVSPYKEYGHDR